MPTNYDLLLAELGARLKPLGLKRSRRQFTKALPYGEAIVRFQKSMSSTATVSRFTGNFLIVHSEIMQALRDLDYNFGECQYEERIGYFKYGTDHWWEIADAASIMPLADELEALFRDAIIPEIHKFSSEETLIHLLESSSVHRGVGRPRYTSQPIIGPSRGVQSLTACPGASKQTGKQIVSRGSCACMAICLKQQRGNNDERS
jgi:hypothetical protein